LGEKIPNLKFFRIDQNTKSSQDLKELVGENFTEKRPFKVSKGHRRRGVWKHPRQDVGPGSAREKWDPNVCPGVVFFFLS